MTNVVDKASGAFFLVIGLAMYFLVIPAEVEVVDGGNIHPDTLPNAVSLVIAACGALLILIPTAQKLANPRQYILASAYTVILATAVTAMTWFGFLPVAPVLAGVVMLMIGERRPLWFAGGVIGMPFVIWVFVVQVLDRPLP